MSELCKQCAACCKNYPFIELSQNDIGSLEKMTGMDFEVFTNPKMKEVEEYFLQFQANGYCFFLKENKGIFSCGVYASRPGICRQYPSNPLQQDACDAHCDRLQVALSTDIPLT